VTKLVVVGCSTTSSPDYCSVAADVLPASSIPVLQLKESGGHVVFAGGIDVRFSLKDYPVPVCWSEEYCRHSVIIGCSDVVFATALWQ
jgi:hypothetical protein